jgi:ribosome-binding protein aMBF1 (putative translation factor)
MQCKVCHKPSEEVDLFKGIMPDGMVMVCRECAEEEGIPIIKKPSEQQLNKADKRYTVRERMERLSGSHDTTEISPDQMITQGNLARLKMPEPKQHNEDVLDNYYWTLNLARRRKKITLSQLAEKMQVDEGTIEDIEKGKLPENFRELFMKLEAFLGIKLLKSSGRRISFTRTQDEKRKILEDVRKKMNEPKEIEEPEDNFKEKISKGEVDFSKREDLSRVTLNDLVDLKKRREKREALRKSKEEEDAMMGDDLDLDIDSL